MRIRLKTVLLTLIATLMAAGTLYAAGSQIRVFLDSKDIPAKTLIRDGELFISVKDLANAFPGRFVYDAPKNRLDIYSQRPSEDKPAAGAQIPSGGISGEVLVKEGEGKEYSVKNVEVVLYASPAAAIPDNMAVAALRRFLLNRDNDYASSHGAVRQAKTDASGKFYLGTIPAGSYELTAVHWTKKGKSGIFWRKKITTKKNESMNVIFNAENAYDLR